MHTKPPRRKAKRSGNTTRGPIVFMPEGRRGVPSIVAALSLVIVANAIHYWVAGPKDALELVETIFSFTHPQLADGSPYVPPFPVFKATYVAHPVGIGLHYVFMPLVLVAALFQFSPDLRARRPALHRWLGRAFFVCLLVGLAGAASKIVAGDLYGGTLSRIQFGGMAIATLVCATKGGLAALRRDWETHARWMWRTYLVTWSSAVLSRVAILSVVPLCWRWMGGDHDDYVIPYNAVLLLSWTVPLLVADRWFDRLGFKIVGGNATPS